MKIIKHQQYIKKYLIYNKQKHEHLRKVPQSKMQI
jgi:hypothetical protein